VTLDDINLLWLRGRAKAMTGGNVSEALDRLLTDARAGKAGAGAQMRSVVGTVDLPPDDPALVSADEAVRALFVESLARPLVVREGAAPGGRPGANARRVRSRSRRG
jgi:hypothetical protein